MTSKFDRVGHLEINHRDSPGLTEDLAHRCGLGGLPVGKGQTFQADTYTCRHCCRVVIMNPLRQRDRAYCAKCDAWICDVCGAAMAASGVCRPFAQIVAEVQDAASRGLDGAAIEQFLSTGPTSVTVGVGICDTNSGG